MLSYKSTARNILSSKESRVIKIFFCFFDVRHRNFHSLLDIEKGKLVCINVRAFFRRCAKKFLSQIRYFLREFCNWRIIPDTEAVIYAAMVKKLKPFQTIKGRKNALKSNPKLIALQVELAQVQHEIETLVDTLTGANLVLLSYVNSKIEELDGRKQELVKKIEELSVETISPE